MPSRLDFRALCGCGGGGLRTGLQQRLVAKKAFAEGDSARLKGGRQRKWDLEELAHPRLLRAWKNGKRESASANHGDAVRERRETTANHMACMVGESIADGDATPDADDKGLKRLPCRDR